MAYFKARQRLPMYGYLVAALLVIPVIIAPVWMSAPLFIFIFAECIFFLHIRLGY